MGRVRGIFVTPAAGAPMRSVDEVRAVEGAGLDGDRYASGSGTYTERKPGRQVTLIESEAIEALARDHGVEIGLGDSRRNIVTEGVSLNHLVGCDFRVGEVTLRGVKLCEPCSHLESLTKPGVRRGLIHRGGLNADIVTGGTIRVGDPVHASA